MRIARNPVFLSSLALFLCATTSLLAAPKKNPYANPYDLEKWVFSVSGFSGNIHSDLGVIYSTFYVDPVETTRVTPIRGEKNVRGSGPGGGMSFSGFYKNWFFEVSGYRYRTTTRDAVSLYNFTQSSSSGISGQLSHISYTWQNKKSIFEPFVGANFFSGLGPQLKTNLRGFTVYSPEIDRYLYYYDQNTSVRVSNPYPQVGVRIKIPIQNWFIAPYYSYSFETSVARVTSLPGNTIQAGNPLDAPGLIYNHLLTRASQDPLQAFSVKVREKLWNQAPGVIIYMDFHRFISLTMLAYRNVTHGRWLVRGVFTFMFHPNVGISALGEYNERRLATFRRWQIGPTVNFQF